MRAVSCAVMRAVTTPPASNVCAIGCTAGFGHADIDRGIRLIARALAFTAACRRGDRSEATSRTGDSVRNRIVLMGGPLDLSLSAAPLLRR